MPSVVHSALHSLVHSHMHSCLVCPLAFRKSTFLIFDRGRLLKRSGRISRAWIPLPTSCVAADLAVVFPAFGVTGEVWRPTWPLSSAIGCQTVLAIEADMAFPAPITPQIAKRHGAESNIADGLRASGGGGGVSSRGVSGRCALQEH